MGVPVQQSMDSFSEWLPDNWNYNASNPCLHVGGNYNQNLNHGLFYVNYNSATNTNANIGCRILVCLANQISNLIRLRVFARFHINGTGIRTPLGEDKLIGRGSVHLLRRAMERP